MAPFESDTAVERKGPGTYVARLSDAFSFMVPSGGVSLAIALRAMIAELSSEQRLISATCVFLRPVTPGEITVKVEILRHGRRGSQARAELFCPDRSVVVLATFATDGEGPDVLDAEMPRVRRPEDLPRIVRTMPFFANVDVRMANGHLPEEAGWVPGPARCDRWVRYEVPPRLGNGQLDPLCLAAVADMMPTALWQKLGPKAPRLMAPSYDLTIHFLDPTSREWLLTSAWCRRARAGYASADVEIWDDEGRLLAYATQTMFFRPWPDQVPRI